VNRFSIRTRPETFCGERGFVWELRNRNRVVVRFGWGVKERKCAVEDARRAIRDLQELEREKRKALAA
jgi:hypothetical protein